MNLPDQRGAPSRGAAAWLMRHLPEVAAVNPERVLINLACLMIGLSAIIVGPIGKLTQVWPFPLYEWAVAMLVGGSSVLLGMFTYKRSVERLGMILIAGGCLFYAGLLLYVFGWPAAFNALIFLAIAAAKIIRLVVTSAVRTNNIRLGEQMKEPSPPPPGGDR